VEPVSHIGAPKKPLVSWHEAGDEVSPKAGVAGSNPAGGTAAAAPRRLTPCRVWRRVIGRDPAVVSVMRCALIMDVAAGRAYCAALRMIASMRCRD
jgi:hypothetical protein